MSDARSLIVIGNRVFLFDPRKRENPGWSVTDACRMLSTHARLLAAVEAMFPADQVQPQIYGDDPEKVIDVKITVLAGELAELLAATRAARGAGASCQNN